MTRTYEMQARARAVADRRERILDAAYELFTSRRLDEITLDAIADAAGVSLKTVVRQFKTKDDLLVACVQTEREEKKREVAPGDVAAVVAVLARRYEQMLDLVSPMLALADRLPVVATARDGAIASHQRWLAQAFAPWLPPRGPVRRQRLLALYGATEIYVWFIWRRRIGAGRSAAAAAMRETLDALVHRWGRHGAA